MTLTVISAPRGQGKTTFLCAQVAARAAGGQSIGGIASPAVFDDGRRIGYDLLDLRCGSRRPLARVATSGDETPTIGVYHFDDDALAAGNAAVIAAVEDALDVIAIDEVGLLEMEGRGWAPALEFTLGARRPQQELVLAVRASVVDRLEGRFPSPLWEHARRVSPT